MDAIKEAMIRAEDDGDYSHMPLLEALHTVAGGMAPPTDGTILRAIDEISRLRAEVASLRFTLGDHTFSADIPEPIGCPMPGACSQVKEIANLRAAIRHAAQLIDNDLIGPWAAVHDLDRIIT